VNNDNPQWAALDPFSFVKPPRSGMVKLVSAAHTSVTLIRDGDITRTGSVGGWQQSARSFQEDADWYQSRPKGSYTLPCMLDVLLTGGSTVEELLDRLYAMGYRPDDDPPEIRLYGEIPAGASSKWRWKLDDIQLGTTLYQEKNHKALRRIELQLMLSTFAPVTSVAAASIKRTRGTTTSTRVRIYTVKQGDTLRAIAVTQLGSSADYKLIQGWNSKFARTDPDSPLRAGAQITLR
jgi:hypothetical protein